MSELIEKQNNISVFVSAVGAWLGLGSGVLFLAFCLFAVTNIVYGSSNANPLATNLRNKVAQDLSSCRGFQVTDEGKSLIVNRFTPGGKLSPVLYSVNDDVVIREEGKKKSVLGNGGKFKFQGKKDVLVAYWVEDRAKMRQVWARKRWGL